MRAKHVAFAVIPSLVGVAVLAVAWARLEPHKSAETKGRDLNREAWEASYLERGLSVPVAGPRDNWHSEALFPKRPVTDTGWVERAQFVDGRIDVDADGLQHWRSTATPAKRILIVGASVAWGSYASSIDATYFAAMGRDLEARGLRTEITVLAGGAWKSSQELAALKSQLGREKYDLAIVIDGTNDLTVGARADLLFQQGDYPVGYIGTDFEDRVRMYLQNVGAMSVACEQGGAKLLMVLQPCPLENGQPRGLEREVITASVGHTKTQLLIELDKIRAGLRAHARIGNIRFLDASRLFNDQTATTFSDLWHFADPGHALLGKALAGEVGKCLAH